MGVIKIKHCILILWLAFSGAVMGCTIPSTFFNNSTLKNSKMNQQEIWKDIPNYEGLYQVSNLGRVKSLDRVVERNGIPMILKGRILKTPVNKCGYCRVNLSKNGNSLHKTIHQLVAIVFLNHKPNGLKLVINHKDFNKLNNNSSNLEIVTNRENCNKKHIKSTSKYTGVYWNKANNKWQSRIAVDGKQIHLGLFICEKEAHVAYTNVLQNLA